MGLQENFDLDSFKLLPSGSRRKLIEELIASLTPQQQAAGLYDWDFWARPEQKIPPGDWVYWLILAGRGAGKTRSGAEAVRHFIFRENLKHVNLIAATESDISKVMIYGPSGIMAVCPPHERPRYVEAKHTLYWPNGVVSNTFSAEKPDRLRGQNHEALWCDELAAWRFPDAFDQAQLGLRIGARPRCVVTTTPRPTKVIKALAADPATVRTGGSTYANRANLAKAFFDKVIRRYKGTRLERQEIYAEILDAVPGALWMPDRLDETRAPGFWPVECAPWGGQIGQ
jgi:phage terminase large subunit-like protein